MRKTLCVCNTYFQLIVAVQLSMTLFQDQEVSVAISDHSRNSEYVYENLKRSSIFKKVFYIRTKNDKRPKIQQTLSYVNGNDSVWDSCDLDIYDEIIFFTEGFEIYSLFAEIYRYNRSVKASRYEEGIFSYKYGVSKSKKAELAGLIRHLKAEKALKDAYANFYCFFPALYHGEMNAVQIPVFGTNPKLAESLRFIFDIHLSEDEYKEKYIYFSSVYDFEGGEPIGEFDLIKKLSKYIGTENLLVKIHPRENVERYVSEGLNIDRNSAIPWEAIQLTRDFSDKIFITATSGAAIASALLQKNSPEIYYLFELCKVDQRNPAAYNTVNNIRELMGEDSLASKLTHVHVAKEITDIPL